MNFSDLRDYNPKLYFDGVCRGEIPLSNLSPLLSPGSPSQNPLIESFLGGPKPPENYAFDYKAPPPLGPNGAYPKPWRSASQFLQDGSYSSQIGPYARFIKYVDNDLLIPDTCVDGQESEKCGVSGGGIWGRLGIGLAGSGVEFYAQDWYNQDQGTYDAAYWSNYFSFTGNAAWQSKQAWWASCSKATIIVDTAFNPYRPAEIEVAYASPQFDDPEYFRGLDLGAYPDYSTDLSLIVVMASVAAITRWVL